MRIIDKTKELAFELYDYIEKMDISRKNKEKLHRKIIDTFTKLAIYDLIQKELKNDSN